MKFGTESRPNITVVETRSRMPPARWAASTPRGMATTSAMNCEKSSSSMVTGSRWVSASHTGCWLRADEPRSPVAASPSHRT